MPVASVGVSVAVRVILVPDVTEVEDAVRVVVLVVVPVVVPVVVSVVPGEPPPPPQPVITKRPIMNHKILDARENRRLFASRCREVFAEVTGHDAAALLRL